MLPNILTILRLLSVPVVLSLAYGNSTAMLASGFGLFLLAAFSDWLDGYLARTRRAITRFGTLMDPVADKLLILGMLFVFSDIGLLPLWLVLINLFRELLVSGIRGLQAAEGKNVTANWMGKLKFCLQVAVIALGFLHLTLKSAGMEVPGGRQIVLYCTLAMTLISLALAFNFSHWDREALQEKQA